MIGYVFCFFVNKSWEFPVATIGKFPLLAISRGNNREIPFVGVASVVNYDETVPMSAIRVQF